MATWRNLIQSEMNQHGETFDDVVHQHIRVQKDYAGEPISDREPSLDRQFDRGYGGSNGDHFTVWTANRVYFPAVYDGSEWCASVPRDPCDVATQHVGGE